MATMKQFEALLDQAEDMAQYALDAIPNTNGSERGKLFASIAVMRLEAARLIHDQLETATLRRQIETFGRRLYAIETALRIRGEDSPTPDVFAEVDAATSLAHGENELAAWRAAHPEDQDDDPATGGV